MFLPRTIYDTLPYAYVVAGILALLAPPLSCWSALSAVLFASAGAIVFCLRFCNERRKRSPYVNRGIIR